MVEIFDLATLVKAMRDSQRRYFRTRSRADLLISKDWERRVDERLVQILRGPDAAGINNDDVTPSMFDTKEGG